MKPNNELTGNIGVFGNYSVCLSLILPLALPSSPHLQKCVKKRHRPPD